MVGERNEADGRVGEHPFHQREDVVPADQPFEDGQVKRETDLRRQTEQVARNASGFLVGASLAAQYQGQGSDGTQENTDDFLSRHRFFQIDGRYNHGDDGSRGSDNGGVDGGSQRQPESEAALIEHDA